MITIFSTLRFWCSSSLGLITSPSNIILQPLVDRWQEFFSGNFFPISNPTKWPVMWPIVSGAPNTAQMPAYDIDQSIVFFCSKRMLLLLPVRAHDTIFQLTQNTSLYIQESPQVGSCSRFPVAWHTDIYSRSQAETLLGALQRVVMPYQLSYYYYYYYKYYYYH